ncbi:hypothetical protein GUJ93_ZPchr0011g26890 [Zizania palustris]|uniref:Uncharacterized protein n=1 Tax=Zizania palustris TaxID=103762 RepID=A0A8J5WDY5_ZIZPA|nr:hypothetical protein GUJ93_ZPchr0011g26890 [Zizania palustris]
MAPRCEVCELATSHDERVTVCRPVAVRTADDDVGSRATVKAASLRPVWCRPAVRPSGVRASTLRARFRRPVAARTTDSDAGSQATP